MNLPIAFTERMKVLLGKEYEAFLRSYEQKRIYALRVNPLKISPKEFKDISPFELRPVPWTKEGFYFDLKEGAARPGKHPYHEAGLYYIQEPSAMSVVSIAEIKPGEFVLDLCAAPGGKSTQIAGDLKGEGLLISNEIHPGRAKILSSNIERMGIANAIVLNETPQKLAEHFPNFFDCIVVDAPCSGEGMFRKDEEAIVQWSPQNVEMCAQRQREILEEAEKMLRPGGRIVYSTCTFAPLEDEGSVSHFLEKHDDYTLERKELFSMFSKGRPEWGEFHSKVEQTYRIWPHLLEGEGHFIALMRKRGTQEAERRIGKNPLADKSFVKLFEEFKNDTLVKNCREYPAENMICFGEHLYLLAYPISLKGLKVIRPGLHLGTIIKGRFEPAHALCMSLDKGEAKRTIQLSGTDAYVAAYLRGEGFACEGQKGYTVVCVNGFALGFGKVNNGMLKNHYPKGLRRNFVDL